MHAKSRTNESRVRFNVYAGAVIGDFISVPARRISTYRMLGRLKDHGVLLSRNISLTEQELVDAHMHHP
jgi:hypothetical protein